MVASKMGKHVQPSTVCWQFNNVPQEEWIYFYIPDNKGKNQRRFIAATGGGGRD
jgi:hypothetical protein